MLLPTISNTVLQPHDQLPAEVIPGSGRLLGHVLAYPRSCLLEGMTSVKCENQNVIYFFWQQGMGLVSVQRLNAGCKSACFTYLNTAERAPNFIETHICGNVY